MTLINSPVALVRSLKGAPLACLFILLLSAETLRAGALCQATGYSPNSITAALRLLFDLHLVEKTPDGWRVISAVRSALLRQEPSSNSVANRDAPASFCDSSAPGGEDINKDSLRSSSPPLTRDSQFTGFPANFGLRVAVIDSNHRAHLASQATDTPSPPSNVARILDATRLLFGERLHGPASRYPDANLLLAAIAEAFVRRHSLRKPARVAYANLKRGIDPGSEFLADPIAYLPEDFLAEAGLRTIPPVELSQLDDDAIAPITEQDESPPEAHPSLEQPADAKGKRSAALVWEMALGTLRDELPRSVFQSYLAPCTLASYAAESCLFTVAAQDEQARLWLQDRLNARLSHLLTGICDRPCAVRFV